MTALIRGGNNGPARVQLRNYLQLHPDDAQALFLFGLTYHREQKYGQAKPYFEQAIAADSQFPTTHYFLAWGLYYLGELDESRRSFERFLTMKPDESDAYFGLGLVDLDEDRLEDAERNLRKSIELAGRDKERPDVRGMSKGHARLAEVYERQDRLHQARSELELATKLFPDHYEAFYKLNRVLTRLGETEAAAEAARQFMLAKERVRPGSTAGASTQPETSPATAPSNR